ncbi:UNVERIFIED_CONTAM: hypothetical protein GTU68_053173, partial [Idotea baltica]|nr:hypothetical protein [Idotea baltica]
QYDFVWNVDNEEDASYYGHKEGAENGRVQGTYYNMLPDGRLMRVDYYVDGESGFVPTITFEGEYSPNWGADFFV